MISRIDAIDQINNKISFIPTEMLNDKSRTVGEMLEDMEANNKTTVTEGEVVGLLSSNITADIMQEINLLEAQYNVQRSETDAEQQPHLHSLLSGKLEMLNKIKDILDEIPPETTQMTIISRESITAAEEFLFQQGAESISEIQYIMENLCEILLGASFYQNTPQTMNIMIEPTGESI